MIIKFNVPNEFIENVINYWQESKKKDTEGSHECLFTEKLTSFYSILFDNTVKLNHNGNIFSHDGPYYPHVDTWDKDNQYNVVIPLSSVEKAHSMIIFDQYVDSTFESCTWIGDNFRDFSESQLDDIFYQKVERARICDISGVYNLTNNKIDSFLFDNIGSNFSKSYLYGLSGLKVDLNVGEGLIFPSTRIHCSGFMKNKKISILDTLSYEVKKIALLTNYKKLE